MPINFMEFLDSAKILCMGNQEIDYRNATSRAYYAAYHEAKRVSRYSNYKQTPKNMGTHQKTIEKLKNHTGKNSTDIRQIGYLLDQCKKQRANADYQLQYNYSKIEADTIILQVENLINLSSKLP